MLDEVDRTNFNVLVESLPEEMTLDEYISLATSNTGFEYLSNENYTVDGQEWNEVVSLNHQEGTKLNQRTFMIGTDVYIFSYASLPENYDKHIEVFESITDSVAIQ
ncbi:DUF1795 domain-containing protein [Salirhabdus sp. Marseille-P4669]|uniref:DUF1795 domain-containing protein n=1 Tax=Salirhabdus sp. Marseille-P4669 TaxID=2042310 RepID=UPI0011AEE6F3|nr:DUF1795 domain-containing protein [Salirhabdus sp. Marseille-P4669]